MRGGQSESGRGVAVATGYSRTRKTGIRYDKIRPVVGPEVLLPCSCLCSVSGISTTYLTYYLGMAYYSTVVSLVGFGLSRSSVDSRSVASPRGHPVCPRHWNEGHSPCSHLASTATHSHPDEKHKSPVGVLDGDEFLHSLVRNSQSDRASKNPHVSQAHAKALGEMNIAAWLAAGTTAIHQQEYPPPAPSFHSDIPPGRRCRKPGNHLSAQIKPAHNPGHGRTAKLRP